jgi:hypothetical protein
MLKIYLVPTSQKIHFISNSETNQAILCRDVIARYSEDLYEIGTQSSYVMFKILLCIETNVKNSVFWDVASCGSCKNPGSRGAYQSVVLRSLLQLLVTAYFVPSALSLSTLIVEEVCSSETRFLQESHGVTSKKTAFFIVTAVKTPNLTYIFNAYLRFQFN